MVVIQYIDPFTLKRYSTFAEAEEAEEKSKKEINDKSRLTDLPINTV